MRTRAVDRVLQVAKNNIPYAPGALVTLIIYGLLGLAAIFGAGG